VIVELCECGATLIYQTTRGIGLYRCPRCGCMYAPDEVEENPERKEKDSHYVELYEG
jgi:hypothetical protein